MDDRRDSRAAGEALALPGRLSRVLLGPVSDAEMRAASVLSAATMALFIGARFLGPRGAWLRVAVTAAYIMALLGFIVWQVFSQ